MAPPVILEPFAARVRWRTKTPVPAEAWRELLASFVQEIASRAVERRAVLVGHVKGIAKPETGGYLHVSVVSADHSATVQGEVPDGLQELTFDLNALIYGLPWRSMESIVGEAAQGVGEGRNCSVSVAAGESRARFTGVHSPEGHR